MLNLWRVLSVSIVLSLVSCQCDTIVSPPKEPFKHEKVLTAGLEKIKKDLALRDELIKRGFDYHKAAHVKELEAQMPALEAYYREAAKNRFIFKRDPDANGMSTEAQKGKAIAEELEKVLKQMRDTFSQKSMSLHKWILFHLQLGFLFSQDKPDYGAYSSSGFERYGALDENEVSNFFTAFNSNQVRRHSFPSFVYSNDGSLGLAALNFAFANDMEVIGAPTNPEVMADAQPLPPFVFMLHDMGHYRAFTNSAYLFKRMRGQLKRVYDQIESQKDPNDRLRDHLGLFFLSHEFPFFLSNPRYLEDLRSIFQETALTQVAKNEAFVDFVRFDEFDPLFKDLLQTSYLENTYNNIKTICLRFVEKYAPFKTGTAKGLPQGPLNKSALEKALKEGTPNAKTALDQFKKLGFKLEISDSDLVKAAKKQIAVRLLYSLGLSQRERQETQSGKVLLSNVRDIADWTLYRSRFDMKFFINTQIDSGDVEITKISNTQYEANFFDETGAVKRTEMVTVTENNRERASIEWTTFGVKNTAEFLKNRLPDNLGPNIKAILEALGYNLDDEALPDALILMIDEFVKAAAKTNYVESTSGR